MERIDPIRRSTEGPAAVQRLERQQPVERRQPGEDERKRKRRAPQPAPSEPSGPDADGHIDVSV